MRKFFLLTAVLCLMPSLSFAESCKDLPSCEELGYFLGYSSACGTDESRYLKCPYDENYRKCINYDCINMGFTATNKTSWCENIVYCAYDSTNTFSLCAEPRR